MDDISVSEKDARFIEKQLGSGRYGSASDVVSAGLQLLEEMETGTEHWLRREIPRRMAEFDRDPSIAIPLDEVAKHLEDLHDRTSKAPR